MSVLIRGMKMPENCYKCPLRRRDGMDIVCPVAHERFSVADVNILEYRLDNCPLVHVPPHGRLIEAETIMKFITDGLNSGEFGYDQTKVLTEIQYAPTIIPAKEGE